eukprot:3276434-Rhodomonas_salina.1
MRRPSTVTLAVPRCRRRTVTPADVRLPPAATLAAHRDCFPPSSLREWSSVLRLAECDHPTGGLGPWGEPASWRLVATGACHASPAALSLPLHSSIMRSLG